MNYKFFFSLLTFPNEGKILDFLSVLYRKVAPEALVCNFRGSQHQIKLQDLFVL